MIPILATIQSYALHVYFHIKDIQNSEYFHPKYFFQKNIKLLHAYIFSNYINDGFDLDKIQKFKFYKLFGKIHVKEVYLTRIHDWHTLYSPFLTPLFLSIIAIKKLLLFLIYTEVYRTAGS